MLLRCKGTVMFSDTGCSKGHLKFQMLKHHLVLCKDCNEAEILLDRNLGQNGSKRIRFLEPTKLPICKIDTNYISTGIMSANGGSNNDAETATDEQERGPNRSGQLRASVSQSRVDVARFIGTHILKNNGLGHMDDSTTDSDSVKRIESVRIPCKQAYSCCWLK